MIMMMMCSWCVFISLSCTGAIILEWNLNSNTIGDNGMWDTHFRIGGAVGTLIRDTNCAKGDGAALNSTACMGAYLLMHVAQTGSVYMENVWYVL